MLHAAKVCHVFGAHGACDKVTVDPLTICRIQLLIHKRDELLVLWVIEIARHR